MQFTTTSCIYLLIFSYVVCIFYLIPDYYDIFHLKPLLMILISALNPTLKYIIWFLLKFTTILDGFKPIFIANIHNKTHIFYNLTHILTLSATEMPRTFRIKINQILTLSATETPRTFRIKSIL